MPERSRRIRALVTVAVVAVGLGAALLSKDRLLIVAAVPLLAGVAAALLADPRAWADSYVTNAMAGVLTTMMVIGVASAMRDPATLDSRLWEVSIQAAVLAAVASLLGAGVLSSFAWLLRRWLPTFVHPRLHRGDPLASENGHHAPRDDR